MQILQYGKRSVLLEKVKQQNKVDGIGKLRTEGRVPMVGLTYKVCSQPRCTGSRHLVMGKTGSGGICRVHHEKHGTGRNISWNQDCWEKCQ